MSSWGNYDNAANTPLWAVNASIVKAAPAEAHAAPTRTNVTYLFGNTTPNAYIAGDTIGLFGVDKFETAVDTKVAHQGWVLRTEGSGGRAGRVQQEVLVALNMNTEDAEDSTYLDSIITISAQPVAVGGPVSAASANAVTYSVTAAITSGNTAPTLSYIWQASNNAGGAWTTITNGTKNGAAFPPNTIISGAGTSTLTVDPTNVDANNYVFRAVVSATGTGATATSANGRILITA